MTYNLVATMTYNLVATMTYNLCHIVTTPSNHYDHNYNLVTTMT